MESRDSGLAGDVRATNWPGAQITSAGARLSDNWPANGGRASPRIALMMEYELLPIARTAALASRPISDCGRESRGAGSGARALASPIRELVAAYSKGAART